MANKNIAYKTNQISEYFSVNRRKWDDFYPSEKWIFERIAGSERAMGHVLDVGCAAGGLALALTERFSVAQYSGVDINARAIDVAKTRKVTCSDGPCQFMCCDILEMNTLPVEGFDNVFSLSCADWNVLTEDIINHCWKYVRKGGNFVLTLRLTSEPSLRDLSESFQYIYYGDLLPENTSEIERAPYVVLNVRDALSLLTNLQPRPVCITVYGYWGTPSSTARTRYDRLVFTALAVKKSQAGAESHEIAGEFHLPVDVLL
ncbi:MAG: class I SAM-dependent methyltransferase [Desulfobacterales bacterium]|nr:class I SAM-dependent methyltransferase [Desulfobacterales bacterium]